MLICSCCDSSWSGFSIQFNYTRIPPPPPHPSTCIGYQHLQFRNHPRFSAWSGHLCSINKCKQKTDINHSQWTPHIYNIQELWCTQIFSTSRLFSRDSGTATLLSLRIFQPDSMPYRESTQAVILVTAPLVADTSTLH